MIAILILIALSLTQAAEDEVNGEFRSVFDKYLNRIHDIESKSIINEDFSKAISKYFNGKLSVFPVFKISMKIDRKPVKIPWTRSKPENITGKKIYTMYKSPPDPSEVSTELPTEAVKNDE